MHHAEDVMRKIYEVCTVDTVTPDVKYLLKRYDYDDLLVVDNMRDKNFVGVIHSEDVSDEALKNELHPFEMKAQNFMDISPVTVDRKATVQECLKLMNETKLRTLPVMDESGHCLGVIKKNDLLRFDS